MTQMKPIKFFDNEAECLRLINGVLKGEQKRLLVQGPGQLVFRIQHTKPFTQDNVSHTAIIRIAAGTSRYRFLRNQVIIPEGMLLDDKDFFKILMFLAHGGGAVSAIYNKFC